MLEPVGVRPGERECVVVDAVEAALELDADADADVDAVAALPYFGGATVTGGGAFFGRAVTLSAIVRVALGFDEPFVTAAGRLEDRLELPDS